MKNRVNVFFAVAALLFLIPNASLALWSYNQDFEGLALPSEGALLGDNWLVFGNVFDSGGNYLYGYGPFDAPNDGAAFCAIVTGEGGAEQGMQQLAVYSDYNNGDHGLGNLIEANVFQEQLIGPGDVTEVWFFSWDAKLGNLEGGSTALGFIKTLDPNAGFATTNFLTVDMTNIPNTWGSYLLYIFIDPSLDGQILQFGFLNTATNYEGSGVIYDNVRFYISPVANEEMSFGAVKSLFR